MTTPNLLALSEGGVMHRASGGASGLGWASAQPFQIGCANGKVPTCNKEKVFVHSEVQLCLWQQAHKLHMSLVFLGQLLGKILKVRRSDLHSLSFLLCFTHLLPSVMDGLTK